MLSDALVKVLLSLFFFFYEEKKKVPNFICLRVISQFYATNSQNWIKLDL